MEYGFVRKLAKGVPEELAGAVAAALLDAGIEVYALDTAADAAVPDAAGCVSADASAPGIGYVSADASWRFPNGDIYVPAADREQAVKLLERVRAIQYLCEDPVESLELTESEKLQADMIRRQRRNMLVCLVIVVLAVIYSAFLK